MQWLFIPRHKRFHALRRSRVWKVVDLFWAVESVSNRPEQWSKVKPTNAYPKSVTVAEEQPFKLMHYHIGYKSCGIEVPSHRRSNVRK